MAKRSKKKIGEILLEQGSVEQATLVAAINEAKASGKRGGEGREALAARGLGEGLALLVREFSRERGGQQPRGGSLEVRGGAHFPRRRSTVERGGAT